MLHALEGAYLWIVGGINGNLRWVPGNAILWTLAMLVVDARAIERDRKRHEGWKVEIHDVLHPAERAEATIASDVVADESRAIEVDVTNLADGTITSRRPTPMTDAIANPTRSPGRLGAKESHEPRLLLSRFRQTFNPAPRSFDGTNGITEWGMDGNDEYPDCGGAMVDHGQVAKAGDASLIDQLGRPKFAGTLETYFAYGAAQGEPDGGNPGAGVDNASWFAFLYKNGIIDGYGEVPLEDLDRYVADFQGVCLAVMLTDQDQARFQAGEVWTVNAANQPDPSLGHDVLLISYTADGRKKIVTWAALQEVDAAWIAACATDAWVFMSKEDAERTGHDWDALKAELVALHGTVDSFEPVVPAPAPEPAPVPDPVPAPVPDPTPAPVPDPAPPVDPPAPVDPQPPVEPPVDPSPVPDPAPSPSPEPPSPDPAPTPEPTPPAPSPAPEIDVIIEAIQSALISSVDTVVAELRRLLS